MKVPNSQSRARQWVVAFRSEQETVTRWCCNNGSWLWGPGVESVWRLPRELVCSIRILSWGAGSRIQSAEHKCKPRLSIVDGFEYCLLLRCHYFNAVVAETSSGGAWCEIYWVFCECVSVLLFFFLDEKGEIMKWREQHEEKRERSILKIDDFFLDLAFFFKNDKPPQKQSLVSSPHFNKMATVAMEALGSLNQRGIWFYFLGPPGPHLARKSNTCILWFQYWLYFKTAHKCV